MWQRIKEAVKRFWKLHIVDDDPEELCSCGSDFVFFKDGWAYCSYCKKPTGTHRSDLKPMTEEEIEKLAKEVNENDRNVCSAGEVRRSDYNTGNQRPG